MLHFGISLLSILTFGLQTLNFKLKQEPKVPGLGTFGRECRHGRQGSDTWEFAFDILEPPAFKKYSRCLSFFVSLQDDS